MSHTVETRNRSDIIINNIFAFQVAMDIMRNDENQNHKLWMNVEKGIIGQNGKK